jgi:glutamate-ammonia-ligase adenylyltransferase
MFITQPVLLPKPYSVNDVQRCAQQWNDAANRQPDGELARWMLAALEPGNTAKPLLEGIFGNSPYLSRLLLLHPDIAHDMAALGADAVYATFTATLNDAPPPELMQQLRIAKGRLALLTALADISGAWPLERVTSALSEFACHSLTLAIDSLLRAAHKRHEIELPNPDSPSQDCGLIVLGMGKLGGGELNYSSDIDLILLFEPGRLNYKGRSTEQHFMNKLAHELVNIMQERDRFGYVFRTDLRLRPDPSSTPPAVNIDAAFYYYESVGQNWERAAMIKARPVAGDIIAGERFLKNILPFMWRRNLDFAAIDDIHSIKRQMDTRNQPHIGLKGHNVKLGLGGIREIEFYAQIHQLIWGGREAELRTRATCETLARLRDSGLIDPDKEAALVEAYGYLRKLEHRLQMVADEQTHSLPDTDDGVSHIARFMGYDSTEAFAQVLLPYLHSVHDIYTSSFKGAEGLDNEGNLVFTGVSHDAETLNTIRRMGYSQPETVSEIIMGWHHGSTRATRTKRARELLTELMPLLLKRLGETANPDAAFLKFDDFLSNLPAGVQLFSLFQINPHLLGLIADIMGSAPTLAGHLSKTPELLEAVLYEDFYASLPSARYLRQQYQEALAPFHDFEARMEALRRFRNEKQFQAGVQLLKQMITTRQAGLFLSILTDAMVQATVEYVQEEFALTYGTIAGSRFAILGLGKLGSREMTFSSDIDLVFIYDVEDFDTASDGEKSFTASVYFNRMSQRIVNALTTMGRNGRLYEVDTRLRPSGKQGLLAISLQALNHYFDEMAWTFEYMAFTKARVVSGGGDFAATLETFVHDQLIKPRDNEKLRLDAVDMRNRIDKTHGTPNPWDIKHVRGGLMDIDFIAQYLILRHAPSTPGAQPGSASEIFDWLRRTGRCDPALAENLIAADRFLGQLFNMLRLCCEGLPSGDTLPPGLKKLLVESLKEKDFAALNKHLTQVENAVHAHYIALLQA